VSRPHLATVDCVRNVYLLPREHRAPGEVRDRLDRAAREAVASAVRAVLSSVAAPGDERVWFIRRLDLDFALNSGADPAPLVRAWAGCLAGALAARLAAGPDDENVVVFPSREAFVARYLADRACGSSLPKWYYGEFDSLTVLPTGTAIRTALAREPERVAGVLRQLARGRALELVLRALSVSDAHAVWRMLAPGGGPGPVSTTAVEALLAALPRAGLRPGDSPTPHDAIRWFVAVAPDGTTPEELHRAVERLLGSAGAALRGEEDGSEHALTPAHREELRRALTSGRGAAVGAGTRPRVVASPFAGLFLAWAVFCSSGLSALCRRAAFRYLVALKLLGRPRVAETWQDPAVLLAAELDRPPAPGEWSALAGSPERGELARELIRWHARRGAATGAVTPERVGDVFLFCDATTGGWLHAAVVPAGAYAADAIREGVGLVASATGSACTLVTDPPGAGESSPRRAGADLAHFSLAGCPLPPGLDPETDLLASLVARAAVRAFAVRLRGFGGSSAEHLYRNFLAAHGDVQLGDEVAVRIDPPPLHAVLRLGGHDEDTFTLADGRRARVTVSQD